MYLLYILFKVNYLSCQTQIVKDRENLNWIKINFCN